MFKHWLVIALKVALVATAGLVGFKLQAQNLVDSNWQESLQIGPMGIDLTISSGMPEDRLHYNLQRLAGFISPDTPINTTIVVQATSRHLMYYGPDPVVSPCGNWVLRSGYLLEKSGDSTWNATSMESNLSIDILLRWICTVEIIDRGGLVLHGSSGVISDRGYLFLGASGRGKSTIIDNTDFDSTLCDEASILVPGDDGGWALWPSPFWGLGRSWDGGRNGPIPLAGIFLLTGKWDKTAISPASPSEAVGGIFSRVLDVQGGSDLPVRVLDTCCALSETTPVKYLSWQLADNLKKVIMT
jgi:hypothetical protein